MNAIVTIQRVNPGPPTMFNDGIAARIVAHIAEGSSLKAACIAEGITRSTVNEWLLKHTLFGESYANARAMQLDNYADEVIEISDATVGASAADVQAAKLRTDNRKWLLSKLRAEVYGDKLDVTSKGEALAAPSHQVDARVQSIVMQAAMRMKAGETLSDEAAGLLE